MAPERWYSIDDVDAKTPDPLVQNGPSWTRPESYRAYVDGQGFTSWKNTGNAALKFLPTAPQREIAPVYRAEGGTGDIAVNSHALVHFADVVDQLTAAKGPIQESIRELATVRVRPGNFFHADQITTKVSGTGGTGEDGLRSKYTENLTKMRDGLARLSVRLRELAKKYETAEQLNSAGAAEVASVLADVGSYMPQLGGTPGGPQLPTMPAPTTK